MNDGAALYGAGERFVAWLERRVVEDARGDRDVTLTQKPADRFWLGRLGSETAAWQSGMGERGQRLEPSAMGMHFKPRTGAPWKFQVTASARVWMPHGTGDAKEWRKSERILVEVPVELGSAAPGVTEFGEAELAAAFQAVGSNRHRSRIRVEVGREQGETTLTVVLANATDEANNFDPNLYEVSLSADVGTLEPFVLDALPDSFRYDRHVPAYGVYCGVEYDGSTLRTKDVVGAEKTRPIYWNESLGKEPDLRFETLAREPMPSLEALVDSLERFVDREWSRESLEVRAREDAWGNDMMDMALHEAEAARAEVVKCKRGLELFRSPQVLQAFKMTNEAFMHSSWGKYDAWRPFQMGFFLVSLAGLIDANDPSRLEVSTLWFATGGGKTETYLALVVVACILDRMRGKLHGITAWSRFPLRMLSLQQTQRFADALAGAELARTRHGIPGDPLALGFYVGKRGTPNKIREDPSEDDIPRSDDPDMPGRYRVLLHCPFCKDPNLQMEFDERFWRLEHLCTNEGCPWGRNPLPFYVVDEEIYRLLPSVVVGTIDKAALVSMQAAMRGFFGPPWGKCTGPGHGFTYASRKANPSGCQVPGCTFERTELGQDPAIFAPSLRIQDELHLLADSLGAIDSHYETLLDFLYRGTGSREAKILASSATLSGYHQQVRTLYQREGSAFPLPGPREGSSFWSLDGGDLARRYVGLAPRGVTQEFASDRIAETLQNAVRQLLADPNSVCNEASIAPEYVEWLIGMYGTHVFYGSKLRDVDAVARSLDSQPPVQPLNVETLTGGTALENVRRVLDRLDHPEPDYNDRIHVVCASSMMSHGVDVDRFNVITLLGLPLATAEFIQTSARIGRRWPGLVFVLHRMAVERDAKLYASFATYVRHGDRFVEAVSVTRNSKRVLERTAPGLFAADVISLKEKPWMEQGGGTLFLVSQLKRLLRANPAWPDEEFLALCDALQIDPHGDSPLLAELRRFIQDTFFDIEDPSGRETMLTKMLRPRPMNSLRDVEQSVPIRESAGAH